MRALVWELTTVVVILPLLVELGTLVLLVI